MDIREEMESLTERLRVYQDTYYKEGVSLVPDSEYDRLTDRLMELEKEHPEYASPSSPTRRVGSDLTSDFPEVEHTIPVLSLDKAYSRDEVLSFSPQTRGSHTQRTEARTFRYRGCCHRPRHTRSFMPQIGRAHV